MHPNKLEFARSVQVLVFNLCSAMREEAQARQKTYRTRILSGILGGALSAGVMNYGTGLLWLLGALFAIVFSMETVQAFRQWKASRQMEKAALHRVRVHGEHPFCLPLL